MNELGFSVNSQQSLIRLRTSGIGEISQVFENFILPENHFKPQKNLKILQISKKNSQEKFLRENFIAVQNDFPVGLIFEFTRNAL